MSNKKTSDRGLLFIYFIMLVIGTVLSNALISSYIREVGDEFYIGSFISKNLNYNPFHMFLFLLLERGKQWIFLIGTLIILPKRTGVYVIAGGFGVFSSVIISIQTMYNGLMGVFMTMVALLPQGIAYGLLVVETVLLINKRKNPEGEIKKTKKFYIYRILLMIALYIVGVWMECYVNPKCINVFL